MPRSPADNGLSAGGGQTTILRVSQSAPLVIVSEQGRHDEASRRLVRAQAARASAAQSRITRARNRDQREGRVGAQSPHEQFVFAAQEPPPPSPVAPPDVPGYTPLLDWLSGATCGALLDQRPSANNDNCGPQMPGAGGLPFHAFQTNTGADSGRQLPLAVPRGFATLRQRVDISAEFLTLISRTACFDFGSPGVKSRLHQLILDLILSSVDVATSNLPVPGHPVQGHLRIACICLTIFQGQRPDGKKVAGDSEYDAGLSAAWSEVLTMDQGALTEPETAQASLWAVFIISVTTGAGAAASVFHQVLHTLFQDLNVQVWEHVRSILLEFIFPVSFLDEPCKKFFHGLQDLRISFG